MSATDNALTAFASSGQAQTAKRPPHTAWALRLVLCATDPRTDRGEIERLLKRAGDEISTAEYVVAVDTAKVILGALRDGAATLCGLLDADAAAAESETHWPTPSGIEQAARS